MDETLEPFWNFDAEESIECAESTYQEPYLEPCIGMEFESDEDARLWYNEYARHLGFGIRVGRNERSRCSDEIISKMFVCFKEGSRAKKYLNRKDRIRRERPQVRIGCKAMIMIKKRGPGKWVLTRFIKEHNHELVSPEKVPLLRSHRRPSNTMRCPLVGAPNLNLMDNPLQESHVKLPLRTQMPMEEQIAELYTESTFLKFQEELCASLCYVAIMYMEDENNHVYRVTKFGEDRNSEIVTVSASAIRASCTCRMFEFVRILCRHTLIVFRMRNVMLLPSHYIFGHYLRNEQSELLPDDSDQVVEVDCRKSVSLRYNDLCQRVLKFAEGGATSAYVYSIAVQALDRSLQEVQAAKSTDSAEALPSLPL